MSDQPTFTLQPSDSEILHTLREAFPGGAAIQLAQGEYVFTKTILLPSNTSIVGAGAETRLVLAERSNCHLFMNSDGTSGNQNISLRNMSVSGNRLHQRRPDDHRALTYSCGVYLRRTKGAVIEDIRFDDVAQTAVHFNNSTDLVVRRVQAHGMGWSGLGTSGASNVWVEDLVVERAGLETTHSGIHFDGGVGISLVGAQVSDATGNGIMLDSAYAPFSHCQVSGKVTQCYRGVSLSGKSQSRLDTIFISGEFAANKEAGVMISNARNVILGASHIHRNENYGLLFQGKAGGSQCLVSSECLVEANGIDYAELHASTDNWIFQRPGATSVGGWEKTNERTLRKAKNNR